MTRREVANSRWKIRGAVASCTSLVLVGGAGIASAADPLWLPRSEVPAIERSGFFPTAPTWSVVGTLASSYTTNALFSRDDRRRDVFVEPDISLRLDGKLTPDLSYRLYARSSFEAFARERLGDVAIARFGGRLTQNVAGWRLTANYENRYDFDGVYRDLGFTSHDVSGSVGRDFTIGSATLSPLLLLTYRFSDLAEARRYRFDALLGVEVNLNEKWSVISTPFIEAFWFTDGLNAGRRDQIYSASLGLRYRITDSISLTTSGAYEIRQSNVALRHYRDFTIGPKLDFAF
jgi:hypothetical protein